MNSSYFKSLQTLESSFRLSRMVMLAVVVGSVLLCLGVMYYAFDMVNQSRNKIYVLEGGKSLMLALAQETNVNRGSEAKDHIRSFLRLLFELEPDEDQISKSMNDASYLGDKASVYRLYTDLKEKGYYQNMIQGDVHQKVEIDLKSIQVDMSQSPYAFRAKGKQLLIRSTTVTVRNLEVTGSLIDVARTDNNPHGLLIEKFIVVNNSDIQTYQRDSKALAL